MAKSKENVKIPVKFKKLSENAVIPSYAFDGDIGLDVTALTCEYDQKKDAYVYGTGLSCESNVGVGDFLFVRSSNCKTDAYLANHVGIVDSATYRGEIKFVFKNRTSFTVEVERVAVWNLLKRITVKGVLKAIVKGDLNGYLIDQYALAHEESYGKMLSYYERGDYAPYKVGDRIGQMVFFEIKQADIEEATELSETERGDGGFGHTGK